MPARVSAGVLLYRFADGGAVEVLIGHMGGPFWARKDDGGWSIPKGEAGPGEEPFDVARRGVAEELGSPGAAAPFLDPGGLRGSRGKGVTRWAGGGGLGGGPGGRHN